MVVTASWPPSTADGARGGGRGADPAHHRAGARAAYDDPVRQRLPLFPLRQVLVPGLVLPLNIFEDRYRALVSDLLERPPHERAFGVVALRQGRDAGSAHPASALHAVGCTALLREHEATPGGFHVVTAGAVRFRLHELDESAGTPYLTGIVSPLDEPDAPLGEAAGDDAAGDDLQLLAEDVSRRWTAYRERLGIAATGLPEAQTPAPVVLSYLVLAGMVLDLPERQGLLEIADTATRLRTERRLLHREDVLITTLRSLPAMDLASAEISPN